MVNTNSVRQLAKVVSEQLAPVIWFSVPGAKHYDNRYYSNQAFSFVNLSVTGGGCACRCDHCNGKLLDTMMAAVTPEIMRQVVDNLVKKGTRGILVSGGANSKGEVPLLPFIEVMGYAKKMGLQVLVHGGLVQPETAAGLKEAGVDQVLMDVIGEERTIHEVYHLDRKPDDYLQSMLYCREAGLNIAPHVVIGLHYGEIWGEHQALEMISQVEPEAVVLVILTPTSGTAMAGVQPPTVAESAEIIARARVLNPTVPLSLGCARPPGEYKRQVEIKAVDAGVNGIAYPDEATIAYVLSKGLAAEFTEECCSLLGRKMKEFSMQDNKD